MISARAITVTRQGRPLLANIDIVVKDGEMLGLVGPNGSGKTTLLRALYGACAMDRGMVDLDGVAMAGLSRRAIARQIAVVPQAQLGDTDQTVGDMVALGRLPHRDWFVSDRRQDQVAIGQSLDRVGLGGLIHAPLGQLSGGERQRAFIARALAQQARHLLLDEPTNHLDLGYQHDILSFVRGLGLATLVVLHDLNLAARYCDRIALLAGGRLVACGSAREVLTPERITQLYRIPATLVETPAGRTHLLFADASNPKGHFND